MKMAEQAFQQPTTTFRKASERRAHFIASKAEFEKAREEMGGAIESAMRDPISRNYVMSLAPNHIKSVVYDYTQLATPAHPGAPAGGGPVASSLRLHPSVDSAPRDQPQENSPNIQVALLRSPNNLGGMDLTNNLTDNNTRRSAPHKLGFQELAKLKKSAPVFESLAKAAPTLPTTLSDDEKKRKAQLDLIKKTFKENKAARTAYWKSIKPEDAAKAYVNSIEKRQGLLKGTETLADTGLGDKTGTKTGKPVGEADQKKKAAGGKRADVATPQPTAAV